MCVGLAEDDPSHCLSKKEESYELEAGCQQPQVKTFIVFIHWVPALCTLCSVLGNAREQTVSGYG